MNKKYMAIMAALLASLSCFGRGIKTEGNGTTYTLATLSQQGNAGVHRIDAHTFLITHTDTIAEGDIFSTNDLEEGCTIRFADGVSLCIEGKADMLCPPYPASSGAERAPAGCSSAPISFVPNTESDRPGGLVLRSKVHSAHIRGIRFEQMGILCYSSQESLIEQCEFIAHPGSTSGAVFLGNEQGNVSISSCTFRHCQRAAVGGAANYACPVKITNCLFEGNSQSNQNVPQLNLTAASLIEIDSCVLQGDSTKTMVGGIGISNFFGTAGNHVVIAHCQVENHRYGITTLGNMDVEIRDCQLNHNKYETNPMNGGSGISLYDPTLQQTAVISECTLTDNLWGITIIGCRDVNIGQPERPDGASPGHNIFLHNGFDGKLYDLYNNSANTVYAQNNVWGAASQTADAIENVVFHQHDDPSLGEVIFMPAYSETDGIMSVSPNLHRKPAPTSRCHDQMGRPGNTIPGHQLYIRNGKKYVH